MTLVRQSSDKTEKVSPKDFGLLKEVKQLPKHVELSVAQATRAPDGRIIRSSSEAERTAEWSKMVRLSAGSLTLPTRCARVVIF